MWKPWSLPRQHVAHTIDGRMSCLFTAGEEPLGTGEGQGWGEGKRCWGFPLVSMDGWRLERACQWYLYSGISSLMGTAVLGSVDLCMGQCIRESSKGGWANSGSPVHSVGRAVLVSPSPPPQSLWWCHLSLHAPQHTVPHSLGASCLLSYRSIQEAGQTHSNTETSYLLQTANQRHWKATSQRNQIHGEVLSESVEGKYSSGVQSL